MDNITRITTDGYRSGRTDNVYLEPGEYSVGGTLDVVQRTIPIKLALYLVEIDKAAIVSTAPPPAPTSAPDLADLKVADLRNLADEHGIEAKGLKKDELIKALTDTDSA